MGYHNNPDRPDAHDNLPRQRLGEDEIEWTEPSSDSDQHETGSKDVHTGGNSGIIEASLHRTTSKTAIDPGPPPDGGLWAWLSVLSSHLVVMNTWGIANSFGVFQSYYVENLNRSPDEIAWIGSISIFLLFFIAPFSGRLVDAGKFRYVLVPGAILAVLGTLTASACTQYWQVLLAQGLCIGVGNGCLFAPSIAILSTWFQKRRSIVIGFAACGSVTGGVLYPVMVRQLLPSVGFGWTMRAIGLIEAVTLGIAIFCLRTRLPPRRSGPLLEWVAFKELEYTFYALGCFLFFVGAYFSFFYVAAYSRDIQGLSYTDSLNLLLTMNAAGLIGRLGPNYIADYAGTLTVFVPTSAAGGILIFAWIAVSSPGGLYAWAALCGIAIGGIQSLFPAGLASLTTDLSKQGTRIGMVFMIVGFGMLTGPPIEGALIRAMSGRYLGAQVFAGSCIMLGTGFVAVAREQKRKRIGGKMWTKV